ncbi:MAG TPA: cupin domain-containing protein [Sphingomicrobium sp.]|jgi:redox-sensitive bicupin YhaK (pirin superfamily)|nr:cupin domain-containing protein [Sphingomicrobium sp.]
MKRLMFLALPLLLVAGSAGQAKTTAPPDLKWIDGPVGLPAGASFAVVSGDPTRRGMFTVQIKMPANYAVRPHWHPTDENLTLVSGKLAYGMSDQLDRANAQALSPGEKVVMKAKGHHWVFTGDGAVIQISSMGPFVINYVDPADDPRGVPKKP